MGVASVLHSLSALRWRDPYELDKRTLSTDHLGRPCALPREHELEEVIVVGGDPPKQPPEPPPQEPAEPVETAPLSDRPATVHASRFFPSFRMSQIEYVGTAFGTAFFVVGFFLLLLSQRENSVKISEALVFTGMGFVTLTLIKASMRCTGSNGPEPASESTPLIQGM